MAQNTMKVTINGMVVEGTPEFIKSILGVTVATPKKESRKKSATPKKGDEKKVATKKASTKKESSKSYTEAIEQKYGDETRRKTWFAIKSIICFNASQLLGDKYYKLGAKRIKMAEALADELIDSGKKITDKVIINAIYSTFTSDEKPAKNATVVIPKNINYTLATEEAPKKKVASPKTTTKKTGKK